MLKLRMRNFRRFADPTEITFPPGLTLMSGPNGAGKSTATEGLLYGLFGPAKRGQERDIRSDIVDARSVPTVTCELEIDRRKVSIHRAGNKVELSVDGVKLVQGGPGSHKAAEERLAELLGGLTRKQFERTYFAMQGDTAGLITEKDSVRREIIENLLQLDVLRKAVELQQAQRDRCWNEVRMIGSVICTELDLDANARECWEKFQRAREQRGEHAQLYQSAIDDTVNHRGEAVVSARRAWNEAENRLRQYKTDHAALKAALDQKEKVRRHHAALQLKNEKIELEVAKYDGQIVQIKETIKRLDADIKASEACAPAAERSELLGSQITLYEQRIAVMPTLKVRYEALTRAQADAKRLTDELDKTADAEGKLHEIEKRAEAARRNWTALAELDPTEMETAVLRDEEALLNTEEKQVSLALEALDQQPGDSRCPTCDQPLAGHAREQRRHHLTMWQQVDLASSRRALNETKEALEVRRGEWKRACETAYKTWERFDTIEIPAARKRVQQRDNLMQQRQEAEHKLRNADLEWKELGETFPYDPTEQARLRSQIDTLKRDRMALEPDTKRHASLPVLRSQRANQESLLKQHELARQTLVKQQSALGYETEAHHSAEKAYEEAFAQYSDSRVEWERITNKHQLCKTELATQERLLMMAKQRQTEWGNTYEAFQRDDRLLALLTGFQHHFFEANTVQVALRTTELAQHAITDQSILGIAFVEDELFYRDASNDLKPIGRLSGGEKALVGLCLRLALAERAQALSEGGGVRFLVLDEVLSSLDEERRDAVQRIFADVLRRGVFEHIIMITHMESVKQGWQASGLEVRKTGVKTSDITAVTMNTRDVSINEPAEV